MNLKYFLPSLFVLVGIGASCTAKTQSQVAPQATRQPATKTTAPTKGSVHQDEGERIFQQNCSRCHTPPDSFSPRISGTVVRHMRVRANLSQHDEQELLRFLNP